MRTLAALLLLLTLPGLLLPAGASLRVCLCAWHGVQRTEGCRADPAHSTPQPSGCASCCAHRTAAPTAPQVEDARRAPCHCVTLAVPDDPLRAAPLPMPPALPAPDDAPAPVDTVPHAETPVSDAWPPAHDRPPPGRHRNLPLRL